MVLDARTHGAVALSTSRPPWPAFTAWSHAQMSRVVPHAGSVFAYATEGLGPAAGFLAGWLAMLDYVLIPSVAYLFSGIALHAMVPAVPAWVFTVAAFAGTTVLNLAGVRGGAGGSCWSPNWSSWRCSSRRRTSSWQAAEPRPPASPLTGLFGPLDVTAVMSAVSIAVSPFLGFDAIAAFAEEHEGDAGTWARPSAAPGRGRRRLSPRRGWRRCSAPRPRTCWRRRPNVRGRRSTT
ncbi:MAG: hypothetical protein R2708_04720 [Vicinamibacterales bacterium]